MTRQEQIAHALARGWAEYRARREAYWLVIDGLPWVFCVGGCRGERA